MPLVSLKIVVKVKLKRKKLVSQNNSHRTCTIMNANVVAMPLPDGGDAFLFKDHHLMIYAEHNAYTLSLMINQHMLLESSLYAALYEDELKAFSAKFNEAVWHRSVLLLHEAMNDLRFLDDLQMELPVDPGLAQIFGSLRYWANYLIGTYCVKVSNDPHHPRFLGPLTTNRF